MVAVAEPDASRRESFRLSHAIAEEMAFADDQAFFAAKVACEGVLICTQDKQHYAMATQALEAGYHVLLEKPMSPSKEECIALGACAERHGRIFVICHVLRYTKFFERLKQLLDAGTIGKLVLLTLTENVGYYHQAHSFVRGNWRKEAESSPMILAKSCHDMDLLLWLAGGNCTQVSSFGGLAHFRAEEAPQSLVQRCIDGCPVEQDCPYSALKIYLHSGRKGWPVNVITPEPTEANIIQALKEGPYGRCVYACDNDVVDHQTVNLAFDNGVKAVFAMSAFTHNVSRTMKLMGSHGEIRADLAKQEIEVHDFATGDISRFNLAVPKSGHGGGDAQIMHEFVQLVASGQTAQGKSCYRDSVQSHVIAFAAEESRLSGKTVQL